MGFIILALVCVFLTAQSARHDSHGISDQEHYKNDDTHEHNRDYDHEAFLGKGDAHSYDERTPEENKKMLGEIFEKVDADSDGQVTKDEMMKWIQVKQEETMKKDTVAELKDIDENSDGYLSWDEYKNKVYGFLDENGIPKPDAAYGDYNRYDPKLTTKEQYAAVLAREERKFKAAEVDGDQKLSSDEFYAFFNPDSSDHMKPILAKETLEDMDKNHDGHVSLEEYIVDYWPVEDRVNVTTEPDWVKEEKKKFIDTHDKNKDGKLDENEIKDYIFPSEDSSVVEEANHLITESDNDGDGNISKDEMVDHYETFIGSHATDFGDLLRDPEDL